MIKLAHAGDREAAVNLPETVRPRIGSAASATLYGADGSRFPARLRQLSLRADPGTRTYEARYVLTGTDGGAPLGATVTLALPNATAADGTIEAPIGATDAVEPPHVSVVCGAFNAMASNSGGNQPVRFGADN